VSLGLKVKRVFKDQEESLAFQVPRERLAYQVWTVVRVFLGCQEERETSGRQALLERSGFRGFQGCRVHLDQKDRVALREILVKEASLEHWVLLANQESAENRERWDLLDLLVILEMWDNKAI